MLASGLLPWERLEQTQAETPRGRQLWSQEAVANPQRVEGAREDNAVATVTNREVFGRLFSLLLEALHQFSSS